MIDSVRPGRKYWGLGGHVVIVLVWLLALPGGAQEFSLRPIPTGSDVYSDSIRFSQSAIQPLPAVSLEFATALRSCEGKEESGFESLEKKLEDQQKTLDDLKSRLDSAVFPGHSEATMQVDGRIHLDHWAFPGDSAAANAFETGDVTSDPQDRVVFRRIRFGVRGDLPAEMEYQIEMEFAGGNDTEYRDVFIGWKELPIFQNLRVGNQKRPYGLDHLNSSRFNVFIERPFVVEGFNQDARRLGIVSYGASPHQQYNWRYGVYNQRLIQDESGFINDHYQAEFAGRLAGTFFYNELCDGRDYMHLAISGTAAHPDGTAPNNGIQDNEARFRTRPEARSESRWLDTGSIAFADWYQLLGLEAVVNLGPWQCVGEYQNVWLQREPGGGPDLRFHGGYVYVSYFLTGEQHALGPRNRHLGPHRTVPELLADADARRHAP